MSVGGSSQTASGPGASAIVAGVAAGTTTFCLVDLVDGALRLALGPLDAGIAFQLVATALAHAAVVWLVIVLLSLALAGFEELRSRRAPRRAWVIPVLATLALSAGYVALARADLTGARLRAHPLSPLIIGGLMIAGIGVVTAAVGVAGSAFSAPPLRLLRWIQGGIAIAAAGAAAALVAWGQGITAVLGAAAIGIAWASWLGLRRLSAVIRPKTIALACLLAGVAAQLLNMRILRGHYANAHALIAIGSLLAFALAGTVFCAGAPPGRRRLMAWIAVAAMAASVSAGLFMRTRPSYQLVIAELTRRASALAMLMPATEPLLARIVPGAAITSGVPAEESTALTGDLIPAAEEQRLLDAALPDRRKLSVIVLTLDTVRADVTGFSGIARKDGDTRSWTPNLDRFATEAIAFERAYTAYPTSNLAFTTLFTGLHPRITPTADPGLALAPRTLLGDALAAAGFVTAALTSVPSFWFDDVGLFGLLRPSFTSVEILPGKMGDGEAVCEAALDVLDRNAGRRILLWVHLMDAHAPYRGPSPTGHDDDYGRYLGNVASADRAAGRLFDGLAARGMMEKAVIVVHSDHGEEFGEHGSTQHNTNLYEPQARVFFMMRVPQLPAGRVTSTVSLADLTPTLLSLLGVADDVPRTGRSLVAWLLGRPDATGGAAYAEHLQPPRRAVWLGTKKLIRRTDIPVLEVFDLTRDPLEEVNLVGRDPILDARLIGLMEAYDARLGAAAGAHGSSREGFDVAAYRRRTNAIVDVVINGSDTDRNMETFANHLFTSFLTTRVAAEAALGTDGVRQALTAVLDHLHRYSDYAKSRLLLAIASSGIKDFLPRIEREWASFPDLPQRFAVRACLGDASVKPLLLSELHHPVAGRPDYAAVLLARLGDAAGAAWIEQELLAGSLEMLGAASSTLSRLRSSRLNEAARLRFRCEEDLSEDMAASVVGALAHDASEDATELLLEYAAHSSVAVRRVAEEALRGRLPGASDVEKSAAALEAEGRRAVRLGKPAHGAALLLKAVERGRLTRMAARLAAVDALCASGRAAEARTVAEKAVLAARDPEQRRRAERILRFLSSPVILEPAGFGARAEILDPPVITDTEHAFLTRVALTNSGTEPWRGGPGPFGCWVRLGWRDSAGRLSGPFAPRGFGGGYEISWLPVEGMMPGETRELHLSGWSPPAGSDLQPVIQFEQAGATLPEGGVIGGSATPR